MFITLQNKAYNMHKVYNVSLNILKGKYYQIILSYDLSDYDLVILNYENKNEFEQNLKQLRNNGIDLHR